MPYLGELPFASPGDGGGAAVDTNLPVDAGDMIAHRVSGKCEAFRNGLVVEAFADEAEHLALARGEIKQY
ncbi:hypothetical protein NOVOSPHI9U_580023 [Novosphingobium sp. 9U]|nr:hypothetical protein NOVOSPHI9U_580023 [Novosphingobium sp. 9U]